MAVKAVRVVIEGRVQGVWFRGWAVQEATRRGLKGWVRNRRDGAVEILLAGEAAQVDDMVKACGKGPPAARVLNVALHPADDPGQGGFRQAATE